MDAGAAPIAPLVIRADTGPGVGNGHVMRCLAIAQSWRDMGGEVLLLTESLPAAIDETIQSTGIAFQTIVEKSSDAVVQLAYERQVVDQHVQGRPHGLILDGYRFSENDIQSWAGPHRSILLMNDGQWSEAQTERLPVDWVWGPLFSDAKNPLHRATQPHLRGLSFALIRREFIAAREQRRVERHTSENRQPLRCLVSLGGTVPERAWRQLLRGFASNLNEHISLDLVLGGSSELATEIQLWLQQQPGHHRCHVWPRDWVALMTQADCAVSAAGGTLLELAAVGVPTLAGAIADNQRLGGLELSHRGLIDYLGDLPVEDERTLIAKIRRLWQDAAWRDQLAATGTQTIDGKGADRVAAWMRWGRFGLRPATPADSFLLWQLRNETDVRANAFNTAEVPRADHEGWLANKLSDPQCRLWVAETSLGEWLGQARWDIDLDQKLAVFSFAIVPAARGWGLASRLIQKSIDQLRVEFSNLTLHAQVKPHNRASQSAFLRVGFIQRSETLFEYRL